MLEYDYLIFFYSHRGDLSWDALGFEINYLPAYIGTFFIDTTLLWHVIKQEILEENLFKSTGFAMYIGTVLVQPFHMISALICFSIMKKMLTNEKN